VAFRREIARIAYDVEASEWIEAPHIVWDPEPLDLTADEAIVVNRDQRCDNRIPGAAVNQLRATLTGSSAPRDDRFREHWHEIASSVARSRVHRRAARTRSRGSCPPTPCAIAETVAIFDHRLLLPDQRQSTPCSDRRHDDAGMAPTRWHHRDRHQDERRGPARRSWFSVAPATVTLAVSAWLITQMAAFAAFASKAKLPPHNQDPWPFRPEMATGDIHSNSMARSPIIKHDFETRSAVNLEKVMPVAMRPIRPPACCICYAVDDEPIQLRPGRRQAVPGVFIEAAHNLAGPSPLTMIRSKVRLKITSWGHV
jgi:hypothetical protein